MQSQMLERLPPANSKIPPDLHRVARGHGLHRSLVWSPPCLGNGFHMMPSYHLNRIRSLAVTLLGQNQERVAKDLTGIGIRRLGKERVLPRAPPTVAEVI